MLEVLVDHLGEVQFEAKARGHKVFCDQPLENGGFDEGMTPPEFLLASLGTCAGYYAVQYLKARHLPMRGLRIRTTAEKVQDPARLDNIHIELEYPETLDERQRAGMLASVHKCLIHNTLLHPPRITVDMQIPLAVAA
jgi:putative redox protein